MILITKYLIQKEIFIITYKGYMMTIRMLEKTTRPLFPMKTTWNVKKGREAGIYVWFKELEAEHSESWVDVEGKKMLMLGGYSYLGLNKNKEINQASINSINDFGTGSSGSRFLVGTTSLHTKLEKEIAKLHQKEDAMVLSSGYLTNVSTIACLVGKNDYIISDKLNHASIIDGARYANAKMIRYKHNDATHLEKILSRLPADARKLVITDSVFSMNGAVADMPAIIKACKTHDAILMVDECHSMFVLGETGGGIVEYFDLDPDDIDIIMSTLSKAIPASGGYITANAKIIDYLRHESRGFIYSGATNTTSIASALKALEIFASERKSLVKKLHENTSIFSNALKGYGIDIGDSKTSIIPIHIGDAYDAACVAKRCHEEDLYIHAVFPPVVPIGKSILRASITAAHTKEDLLMASKKIADIINEIKVLNADITVSLF